MLCCPSDDQTQLRSYLDDDARGLEARAAALLLRMEQGWGILEFDDLNWLHDSRSARFALRDGVFWKYGIEGLTRP